MRPIIFLTALLCAFSVHAANPTFGSFDTNHFNVNQSANTIEANTNGNNPRALVTQTQMVTKVGAQISGSNYTTSAQIAGSNYITTSASNQLSLRMNPIPLYPVRLFILGDSKSVIDPSGGVSNQWPRWFTNLPYWRSNVVFFTNSAVTAATIVEITNQYRACSNLFAPPGSGTNNLVIIRDGANDFPTNSSVSWWINIYSNMVADAKSRANTYVCGWDIQPRTDHPDTVNPSRDAMNQAYRRLTNGDYFVKAEKLVPNATLTDLFFDGIHANTNGAMAEANICDYAIRFGPYHFYDEPKSYYENASISVGIIAVQTISSFAFNTTYSNTNGYPIMVRCNYQFATVTNAGNCGFSAYVNGTASASRGFNTAVNIPPNSGIFGDVTITVPAFGNYAFTNSSTGTGNTVTLFGGQVTFY